jgi:hypothetical protein
MRKCIDQGGNGNNGELFMPKMPAMIKRLDIRFSLCLS